MPMNPKWFQPIANNTAIVIAAITRSRIAADTQAIAINAAIDNIYLSEQNAADEIMEEVRNLLKTYWHIELK